MDVEYLKTNWLTTKVSVLAEKLGMTDREVRKAAERLKLGKRLPPEDREEPSQEEIARRAAAVRAQWSRVERERRRVGNPRGQKRWSVPVIETGEIEAPTFSRI